MSLRIFINNDMQVTVQSFTFPFIQYAVKNMTHVLI